MTTTRIIRRELNDTSDPDIGFTSTSTSGSGQSFSGSGITRSIGLANSNPSSETFRAHFETDLKITDDVFNIPADRCIVTYKCRPNITVSSTGGGLGGGLGGDLPVGTPDLAPPAGQGQAAVPSGGLGVSQF